MDAERLARLAKVLNLTRSENDHEALAAIRRANAMIEGKDWAILLGTAAPAPQRQSTDESVRPFGGYAYEFTRRAEEFRRQTEEAQRREAERRASATRPPYHKDPFGFAGFKPFQMDDEYMENLRRTVEELNRKRGAKK